jgi:hypothetical protein
MNPSRWHAVAALCLVAIGTLRIVSTYPVLNHTIDEPDNLAAGMEYLSTGRYLYHDENPPFARVFAAVGPYLAGERYHPGPEAHLEGDRILGKGAHYDRMLALARAGILPFYWTASLVVFLWARRVGGAAAAVAATALFSTIPPILGLSGIANTDMALCATASAATLAGLYWAKSPTRSRSITLGVLIALAILSKFTAIPFLAAGWTLMFVIHPRRRGELWKRRRAIAVVLGVAALAIWAAYGFTFARVEFLHARLPAPRLFTGMEKVWAHQKGGHPAYLLGRRSPGGFWYYYPVVLALKTPLAFFGFVLAAVWLGIRGKRRIELLLPLAFAAGILLISMLGHVNIGVRYVLPAYVGLSVAAGCAAVAARHPAAKLAAGALLAWHVLSGALQHPDYLAYTNEIAGAHPERVVADSDLDWGQDMKRLASFLQSQGVDRVTFTPFNTTYAMPIAMTPGNPDIPTPGWNAVSITLCKVFGNPAWPDRLPPQKRVGKGILLWYFEKPN